MGTARYKGGAGQGAECQTREPDCDRVDDGGVDGGDGVRPPVCLAFGARGRGIGDPGVDSGNRTTLTTVSSAKL
ncbi:unnamed protein product, partial [Musa acuminata var. zebrina]